MTLNARQSTEDSLWKIKPDDNLAKFLENKQKKIKNSTANPRISACKSIRKV